MTKNEENFIKKINEQQDTIDGLQIQLSFTTVRMVELAKELEALQAPKMCYCCKWYRDFEAVCVNGDCPLCADFVSPNFGCIHFEPKDK